MALPHPHDDPLIVVDMDDVICDTNAAAAKWHNDKYGTDMSLSDFHYYHWWKNPGWGTPQQTMIKANMFYASLDFLELATPLPGSVETLKTLKQMGYRLAIVTARSNDQLEQTTAWTDRWMNDIFESFHFTGDIVTVTDSSGKEHQRRLTKGEVCDQLSASLLIDDSVQNVFSCVTTSSRHTPALLFGGYEWGKRNSLMVEPEDFMSFEERKQYETAVGRGPEWWKEESIDLPKGVWRVNDWAEVLEWIQGVGKEFMNTRVV